MKTLRLYWTNTYLFQTAAKIVAIGQQEGKPYLQLNQTIFYPQGGGQAADKGTINGIEVTKLVDDRTNDIIYHFVADTSKFQVGQEVDLAIDARLRLLNAALHTAGHVTAGVLRTQSGYREQVGANHLDQKQASVTFKADGTPVSKETLQQRGQAIIDEKHSITESFNPAGVREIEIEGLWKEACCGTHVDNTAELDAYAVRKVEVDKKTGHVKAGYSAGYNGLFFESHEAAAKTPDPMAATARPPQAEPTSPTA